MYVTECVTVRGANKPDIHTLVEAMPHIYDRFKTSTIFE